jgi:hypothetical protein
MQVRYGLVAAWVVATIASMLVAFAAVGSVRNAIADPPSALLLPETASQQLSLPPASTSPSSTLPDPEVDDGTPIASGESVPSGSDSIPDDAAEPETPSPTQAPPVATTAADGASTTVVSMTSTTQPATTAPPADDVETYETEGGWVTLRSSQEGVFLESASPKPGWTVKTEGSGPEHFTVVFKGEDEEIHVAVSFESGRVDVDIED